MSETALEPPVTGMLPGTPIESLEELSSLPHYSVVLVRSRVQPYFRTAWTLSIVYGRRTWHSALWRASPSDDELFEGAVEPAILLYKPLEQFGIGKINDQGWLDNRQPVVEHPTYLDAVESLKTASGTDPRAVLTHRIHPGPWQQREV